MTDIEELVLYYESRRGIGHTWALLNGALRSENCLVVASDRRQENDFIRLGIPGKRVTTYENLMERLPGKDVPVVVDHHALVMMLRDVMRENQLLRMYNAKLSRVATPGERSK